MAEKSQEKSSLEKQLENGMMSMTLEYRIEDRVPDKTKAERCRAIAQNLPAAFSPPIILISMEKEEIETTWRAISLSSTINAALLDAGFDGDCEEPWIFPVPAVCSKTLHLVVDWCQYHQYDVPVSDEVAKMKELDPWDIDFLEIDNQELFNLILAANFMDIQGLMDVTCRTVANMIKGKSSEEIRKTFGITDDDEEHQKGNSALTAAAMKLAKANIREGKAKAQAAEAKAAASGATESRTPSPSVSCESSSDDYNFK